jgi:hypothetical protein
MCGCENVPEDGDMERRKCNNVEIKKWRALST